MIDRKDIEIKYHIGVDWFGKADLGHPPVLAVRQHHPLAPLIAGVVQRLFRVRILQLGSDRLNLDQDCKLPLELDG